MAAGRDASESFSYDKNGNVTALTRPGDNLAMTLDGNRLKSVHDKAEDAPAGAFRLPSGGFHDRADKETEYAYDKNGNMTQDLNRNINGITYNSLNLPEMVAFSSGDTVTNTYLMDGTKLETVRNVGGATTTTDYCGNLVYENGVLKYLLTEEGYVTPADGKYHYYVKDHLGSNRIVAGTEGKEEWNYYYPSGLQFVPEFKEYDGVPFDRFISPSIQPYRYNGKKRDGNTGWYDYGARYYDPALMRFTTMDPMAEKYYSVSPYAYCLNSPVRFVDPSGQEVIALDEESKRNIQNSVSEEEAKYIVFDDNGILDIELLNSFESDSENFKALKALANSETRYKFKVAEVDVNGDSFSETYKGMTAFPGAEYIPSKDGDVWFLTNSNLDEKGQAMNLAHEAYGHGYFYELHKHDSSYDYQHRPKGVMGEPEWDPEFQIYVYPSIKTETNLALKKQIEIVTKQAGDNYDKRKK